MKQFVLSIQVANNIGVLTRVTSLVSRRGYNIKSLNVGETEENGFSRITMVVEGDERTAHQIVNQLNKLYDVSFVRILEDAVCREHILMRVGTTPEDRQGIIEITNLFKAKAVDIGEASMMLELTGSPIKIDKFISLLKPFGIIKIVRTGISALERD
ncbi:MAG: acetolactate synthase small subunit [Ruminiclostridium sp.]